ncbi:diphthine--ammonia ligase [Prolixibacter sp. NT017]|uniref:Dph6-related ATP pyrophosphatase n=1 Tax=Prolixibacter sp. NT017 TaxID=2652390 RepID=UPI00188EE85B|nr:diphthine--ammonia ligase [Prolixibacter sp. NT017]
MKLFSSFSGGKDCMLALHRVLSGKEHQVACLLNMCAEDGLRSLSHGLNRGLLERQSQAMNIPVFFQPTGRANYETKLKEVIARLKEDGIEGGIFGDIYLEAHRVWIERVCRESGIIPVFPLWNENTRSLAMEFVSQGFKALTISVRQGVGKEEWLGQLLDNSFFSMLEELEGIDPCGENGEYHSFVFDGPIFEQPVAFTRGKPYTGDNHWFLPLV